MVDREFTDLMTWGRRDVVIIRWFRKLWSQGGRSGGSPRPSQSNDRSLIRTDSRHTKLALRREADRERKWSERGRPGLTNFVY